MHMRRYIFILVFKLVVIQQVNSQTNFVEFGVSFSDTIELPNEISLIDTVWLYKLDKKFSRDYYSGQEIEQIHWLPDSILQVIGKKKNKHAIFIPSLDPNHIYRVRVKFMSKYNIYGLFRCIHECKVDLDTFQENVHLKEIIDQINICDTIPYDLFYAPNLSQLNFLKERLNTISLPPVFAKKDSLLLKEVVIDHFPILKFRPETKIDSFVSFAMWAKASLDFKAEDVLQFSSTFNKIPDYVNIFDFYKRRLKDRFEHDQYFEAQKTRDTIDNEIRLELSRIGSLPAGTVIPNFLQYSNRFITSYDANKNLTTYSKDFATSYQRRLILDFGYIGFLQTKDFKGGSPFLGVNIALKPSNKNTSFSLSKLDFWQKSSLHLGLTLNSLKKENRIEDFFGKTSLTVGYGYKFLNHSTRIVVGTVVFNQIQPLNLEKNLRLLPYIGLSIDIEIYKWIESSSKILSSLF